MALDLQSKNNRCAECSFRDSSFKPRNPLQSDIESQHHEIKKDFKKFFNHCKSLSEALELMYSVAIHEEIENDINTTKNIEWQQKQKTILSESSFSNSKSVFLSGPH